MSGDGMRVGKWERGLFVAIGVIKWAPPPLMILSSSLFLFFFFKHMPTQTPRDFDKQSPHFFTSTINADQTCNHLQQRLTLNQNPAGHTGSPWDRSVAALCGRGSDETRLSLSLGSGWKLGEHLHVFICKIWFYQLFQHTEYIIILLNINLKNL